MSDTSKLVAQLIYAAGGELVGKIKLQKSIYFLTNLGINTSIDFDYYYYGPYSKQIDDALSEISSEEIGILEEQVKFRVLDGAKYSVFKIRDNKAIEREIEKCDYEIISKWASIFAKTNSTILELAATIHWLKNVERISDWRQEIITRKGAKTRNGKLDKAIDFLVSNNIMPELVV